MEEKQIKPKNKKRTAITAVCASLGAVAAVGAGVGIAYAIFYDKEAKKEHTIEVDTTIETYGFKITPSVDKAKKGDTVRFDVTKNGSRNDEHLTYIPKSIKLTSTGFAGPSEYSLIPNGKDSYYANVKILYQSNMKVELIFNIENDWVVTFDVNGGKTQFPQQYVHHGEKVTKPITDPQKDGHDFVYWYAEGEGGAEFDFANTIITGNITLKAKWLVKTNTVTWLNDDGKVLELDETVPYGATPTYDSATPTKEKDANYEYVFAGWNNPITTMGTEPVTYKATYTPKVRSYTVDFHNNDHGFAPASIDANYGETISKPNVYDDAYDLVGWYTDKECSEGKEWVFTAEAGKPANTITGKTDLYAKWTPKTYKVKFDLAGGTGGPSETEVTHGTTLNTPTEPKKEDFTFAGWTVEGKNDWVFNNTPGKTATPVTKDITFVANWTSVDYYVMTFNYQDGSNVEVQSTKGQTSISPKTPTPYRSGYKFLGWFTQPTGGEKVTFPIASTKITANATYYAQWEIEQRTVTFHANTVQTVKVNFNDKVTIPQPPTSLAGKKFAGWYKEAAFTNVFNFDDPITKDTDVYAKFVDADALSISVTTYPKLEYTVGDTFDSTGMIVKANLEDGTTTELTKGAETKGYYIDVTGFDNTKPGTYPIVINHKVSDSKTVSFTFNVKVKQKIVTVTFDTNYQAGGPTYQSFIDKETTVAQPLDPAREGYTFTGWYTEPECTTTWNFADKVEADMTLYAGWKSDTVAIIEPSSSTDRKATSATTTSSWSYTAGDKVKYTFAFPGTFTIDSTNGLTPADLSASANMSYEDDDGDTHTYSMSGNIVSAGSDTFKVELYKEFTYDESASTSEDMYYVPAETELTVSDFKISANSGQSPYKCKQTYKAKVMPSLVFASTADIVIDVITPASGPQANTQFYCLNNFNDTFDSDDITYTHDATTEWVIKTTGEYYYDHSSWGRYPYYNKQQIFLYTVFTTVPTGTGQLQVGFELKNNGKTYFKKDKDASPKIIFSKTA